MERSCEISHMNDGFLKLRFSKNDFFSQIIVVKSGEDCQPPKIMRCSSRHSRAFNKQSDKTKVLEVLKKYVLILLRCSLKHSLNLK